MESSSPFQRVVPLNRKLWGRAAGSELCGETAKFTINKVKSVEKNTLGERELSAGAFWG